MTKVETILHPLWWLLHQHQTHRPVQGDLSAAQVNPLFLCVSASFPRRLHAPRTQRCDPALRKLVTALPIFLKRRLANEDGLASLDRSLKGGWEIVVFLRCIRQRPCVLFRAHTGHVRAISNWLSKCIRRDTLYLFVGKSHTAVKCRIQ